MKCDINEAITWAHSVIDSCMENESFQQFVEDPLKLPYGLPNGIYQASGCTRLVLWTATSKYVIKIQYCDFDTADYCAGEEMVYNAAADEELEDYFAWTHKAFDIEWNGYKRAVYVMEYCEVDYDNMMDDSTDYAYHQYLERNGLENTDENQDKFYNMFDTDECTESGGMLAFASSIWGETESQQVEELLDRLHVNDCHAGNWGYTKDNHLVICDYAGYGRKVG